MLAFVGEAKDGLCGKGLVASLRMGIRLGVVAVASTKTDVSGEILRRFDGDDSICRNDGESTSLPSSVCVNLLPRILRAR